MKLNVGRLIRTPFGTFFLPPGIRIAAGAALSIICFLMIFGTLYIRGGALRPTMNPLPQSTHRMSEFVERKYQDELLSKIFGLRTDGTTAISLESTIMGDKPVALIRIGTQTVHVGVGDSLPGAHAVVDSIGRGLIILRMKDEIIRIGM